MNIYQRIDTIAERLEGYKLHNPKSAKLSYSGGRDSHLLLHIIRNVLKQNNEQFPAIYAKTYNEFAEIRHRIEEQDITSVHNGRKIFEIFKTEGLPLYGKQFSKWWNDFYVKKWNVKITNETVLKDYTKRSEWVNSCGLCISDKCCKVLKEDILHKNKANIVGLRKEEKGRRSTGVNKEYDFCVKNSKILFKPIFDVSDSELEEIEKVLGIPNPNIYNYLSRTGCVMCGFGTKKMIIEKIKYLYLHEPSRAKFYVHFFNDYLKYRKII
jgi:3'-phosphoadenosine 5'-phosphosulfate sulfotransferase (PAPS reductase)/FAD synthetase